MLAFMMIVSLWLLGVVRLLDSDDAMQALGWNPSKPKDRHSYYRWLGEGWVPKVRLGRSRRVRIREDDLLRYVEKRTEAAGLEYDPSGKRRSP